MQQQKSSIPANTGCCTRIVVKFYDHAQINYSGTPDVMSTLLGFPSALLWKRFFSLFRVLSIEKLFNSVEAAGIAGLARKARRLDTSYEPPDLLTYYVLFIPDTIPVYPMLRQLRAFTEVEQVYPQCIGLCPALKNMNARTCSNNGYLQPAPLGINAAYAGKVRGGAGIPAVKFIDVEQGWILTNRSPAVARTLLTGINNYECREHGTAVLDIVLGNLKSESAKGIAPGVTASVISQWRSPSGPNDPDAILAAITYLDAGDILLLEMQTFYAPGSNKVWPSEVQEATYQVIRLATALGIIVIEAAGNGDVYTMKGNDLDSFLSGEKKILNPQSKDFRDSGAIIVAAATMNVPHSRLRSSNYGRRIDCYAWGEGIAAGELHNDNKRLAPHQRAALFGGTSGAAAIIAGAALVVQSISIALHKIRLTPSQMRYVLSSEQYGTQSSAGVRRDKIGVMPDLEKIIDLYLYPGKYSNATVRMAGY